MDVTYARSPLVDHRRIVGVAIVLTSMLLGSMAGWWVGGTRSTGFVSTASVVINPLPGNALWEESVSDIVTLQTEAQQARSDEVLASVADKTDSSTNVDMLRRRVSVSVATGSEVVLLSYKGNSVADTASVAAALAEATLDQRRVRAAATRDQQVLLVEDALDQVIRQLNRTEDLATVRVLERRRVLLEEQLRQLDKQSLLPGSVLGVSTQSASRKAMHIAMAGAGACVGLICGQWLAGRVRRRSQ